MLELTELAGFASIQGRPRFGRLKFGIPLGGAFDQTSMTQANRIVGNDLDAPILELALSGATFTAHTDVLLGFAGAPVPMFIGTRSPRPNEPVWLRAGESLAFKPPSLGVLTVIAIRGGFADPPLVTTPVRAGALLEPGGQTSGEPVALRAPALSMTNIPIEMMLGPHSGSFSVANLFQQRFAVTPNINRQGLRLQGFPLPGGCEIVSEPCCPGTVQVTPNGQLIVLGPDGPTVGGYPKVGILTREGLDRLAQLRPGERAAFKLAR